LNAFGFDEAMALDDPYVFLRMSVESPIIFRLLELRSSKMPLVAKAAIEYRQYRHRPLYGGIGDDFLMADRLGVVIGAGQGDGVIPLGGAELADIPALFSLT
jgi:hypothetical protein